ncbi:MAG: glycosyltransferase [Ferruginibacter sp.]
MKIDTVYVLCNKRDFYFASICVASIRYWNKNIPVYLVKDYLNGDFETQRLEMALNVEVVPATIKNLGYLAELYPFIEKKDERALVLDADIIWMGDLIPILEQMDEDIVIDGYSPENMEAEKQRWYFFEPSFSTNFPGYVYPGFFFNSGHILFNTRAFSKEEFLALVHWQEFPSAKLSNTFFTDQGILNYIVAERIKSKSISYKNFKFQIWGWDKMVGRLAVEDIRQKKSIPYLVHWYGPKNGLISFLPGSRLLKFYEAFYFSHLSNGNASMQVIRIKRTLQHIDKFLYEFLKKVYYFLRPPKN